MSWLSLLFYCFGRNFTWVYLIFLSPLWLCQATNIYMYIYISGLARPQGRQKNKKNQPNSSQSTKTKRGLTGYYIYKCKSFLPFSHARNKGFPMSNWHQTFSTCSTHILPKMAKYREIWPSRTRVIDRWILCFGYRRYTYIYTYDDDDDDI